jgi:hypothetical protein
LYLCVRVVRETFPEFKTSAIPGLNMHMILTVARCLGFSATPASTTVYRRNPRAPSLAAMTYQLRPRGGRTFLIVESERGHILAMRGWKIYDSYIPGGIGIRKYPFRKIKVGYVWEIRNPRMQCCLPFAEIRMRRWTR